jgi:DNA repair protein RecO (recombination protein O)
MNQLITKAIILSRTDYGEADRILTLLTPDYGKLRVLARGVRRVKSKLAGGIELFSVSHITFIKGRGDIGTLVSTRLDKHYGRIVADLERTMAGYDLIKLFNKNTEDEPEAAYFELLQQTFEALDDPAIPLGTVHLWFAAQLLRLSGYAPNLHTDVQGNKLQPGQAYNFDIERMAAVPADHGRLTPDHIKYLRLAFGRHSAKTLAQVQGGEPLAATVAPLARTMLQTHLRV